MSDLHAQTNLLFLLDEGSPPSISAYRCVHIDSAHLHISGEHPNIRSLLLCKATSFGSNTSGRGDTIMAQRRPQHAPEEILR